MLRIFEDNTFGQLHKKKNQRKIWEILTKMQNFHQILGNVNSRK